MWNRTENQIEIVLIRHGETDTNREHRYLGLTDESLSEEGRRTLLSDKEKFRYPSVQILFSSPMKRCLETAEILYPDMQPMIIPEWREMDFGMFEYCSYEELKSNRQYQAWIESKGMIAFPEGESREDFIARCERGFLHMFELLEQKGILHMFELPEQRGQEEKTMFSVGMIVHGGTIMALLSRYYGGDYFDYQIKNGGGYLCRIKGWNSNVRVMEIEEL